MSRHEPPAATSKVRRLTFAVVGTLLLSLGVTGSASSAPGEGATKTKQSFCYTEPVFPGGTFCFDLNYVVKTTQTPSGNTSFVTNGRNVVRASDGFHDHGCVFSQASRFHRHYLLKDGTLHEEGNRRADSFSVTCPGPAPNTLTCTYTLHAHYANGSLQYNRPDAECTQT